MASPTLRRRVVGDDWHGGVHDPGHPAPLWGVEGEPVATQHKVAFTVFAVCGPSYPRCYLLRLSRLDEPLK